LRTLTVSYLCHLLFIPYHFILYCFFYLFFFYRSGHPRDLHSFPTRRSSDLSGRVVVTRYAPDPSSRPNRLTDGEDARAEAISDEVPWRSLNSTAFALPNRRFRFSGVSICTIRPWLITAIRLQSYSSSSRMCVVKKIVRPCRTRSFR